MVTAEGFHALAGQVKTLAAQMPKALRIVVDQYGCSIMVLAEALFLAFPDAAVQRPKYAESYPYRAAVKVNGVEIFALLTAEEFRQYFPAQVRAMLERQHRELQEAAP